MDKANGDRGGRDGIGSGGRNGEVYEESQNKLKQHEDR